MRGGLTKLRACREHTLGGPEFCSLLIRCVMN